jgi:hypothetical protein
MSEVYGWYSWSVRCDFLASGAETMIAREAEDREMTGFDRFARGL